MTDKFIVEYLPIAKSDIEDIIDYISKDNPSVGKKIIDEFDNSIGKLSSFPKMGTKPKDERLQRLGYRVLVLRNYLIFYMINEEEKIVEIRRIIHGSRKYSFLL